ncbi:MAG TPA: DUF494 family protein [candidate division Zixibacteria bacterium]|nr:DUF494 family protein [candidate division Zixibacteria bacterium]
MSNVPTADAKFVDLLLYLAELMRQNVKIDPHRLERSLGGRYSKSQIKDALTLLKLKRPRGEPVRIFSESELAMFDPDAARLLLKLYSLGVVEEHQLEAIIMQADIDEEILTVDDVKTFVAIVLSDPVEFNPETLPVFQDEEFEN